MIEVFYYDEGIRRGDISVIKNFRGKNIWVDVFDITLEEKDILQKLFKLHDLTAEDLVSSITRIKIEEFSDYLFCVFYGASVKKGLDMFEMDFVVGKNFVISNHKKQIVSFEDLKKEKEKLSFILKNTPEYLLHKLIDMEVDNYFPVLEKIDDMITEYEEKILEKPNPRILNEILKLKKKVLRIRKAVFTQREKIGFLSKNEYKFISKKSLPYFRDVYDHMIRVSDSVEDYREAISSAFDTYMSSVSNNMNEVMKTLSVIATIALPLTVVSGIYGTNFSNLPGQNLYYGFWIMIGIMVSLAGGMLYFFRKRNWF